MELEEARHKVQPSKDVRKRMDEPLPVFLEAVADMHLPRPATDTKKLDWLYVSVLGFAKANDRLGFAYHAGNFDLLFDLERADDQGGYRPVRIIGRSLVDIEHGLVEGEVEYTRQKGLLPGHEAIVMQDPDGNWLEIREYREIG